LDNSDYILSVIKKIKLSGADKVDVLLTERSLTSVSTRFSKLEKIEQANVAKANVRVFVGNKNASISTDSISELKSDDFIEKVIFAAQNSPEENEKLRADSSELCKNFKKIDTCDRKVIGHEKLIENAKECESVALQIDGITNSEKAEAGYSHKKNTLIMDDEFIGEYEKSKNYISIITLAKKNENLERDYAFSEAVYYDDLKKPSEIAKEAAEKTLRKLGAKKIRSCKVPVMFHRDVSRQLLQSILMAINGSTVAKGMSFLKDKLHKKIFSDSVSIVDRYDIDRGLRSRPFDSDGLECRNNHVMTKGTLNSFLLNVKYANELNMKSTSNANGWDAISPNNVCIENGKESFHNLMKKIRNGLYVTDVLGNGLNVVTGNYSQGAAGFWIENGEIAYPVNEITVSGSFLDMFLHCNVASDLLLEFGFDSPTIFVEEMVVGGI
jgi:PmbA protein